MSDRYCVESVAGTAIKNTNRTERTAFPPQLNGSSLRPRAKEISFALGRSDEPLSWGGNAVRSVRLVFLIAVPATDSTQYLSLISGLARLAKEERLVEQLHAAPDTDQIFEALHQVKLRSSTNSTAKTMTP